MPVLTLTTDHNQSTFELSGEKVRTILVGRSLAWSWSLSLSLSCPLTLVDISLASCGGDGGVHLRLHRLVPCGDDIPVSAVADGSVVVSVPEALRMKSPKIMRIRCKREATMSPR